MSNVTFVLTPYYFFLSNIGLKRHGEVICALLDYSDEEKDTVLQAIKCAAPVLVGVQTMGSLSSNISGFFSARLNFSGR